MWVEFCFQLVYYAKKEKSGLRTREQEEEVCSNLQVLGGLIPREQEEEILWDPALKEEGTPIPDFVGSDCNPLTPIM